METYVQMFTTVSTEKDAERVAKTLVEKRLAAVVQIFPTTSIYRREGRIETAEEWRLSVKTRMDLCSDVEAAIRDFTSRVASEMIVTPILGGSYQYLDWLNKEIIRK